MAQAAACLRPAICRELERGRSSPAEEDEQQVGVDQDGNGHHAVGPRACHEFEVDQHPRQAKADDPGIKAHADPAKRLGIEPADDVGAKRYADQHAGHDHHEEARALGDEQAEIEVDDRGQARLGDADQGETGAKLVLTKPWLLNRIASGGPEIVVTEYSTPSPMPKGTG